MDFRKKNWGFERGLGSFKLLSRNTMKVHADEKIYEWITICYTFFFTIQYKSILWLQNGWKTNAERYKKTCFWNKKEPSVRFKNIKGECPTTSICEIKFANSISVILLTRTKWSKSARIQLKDKLTTCRVGEALTYTPQKVFVFTAVDLQEWIYKILNCGNWIL